MNAEGRQLQLAVNGPAVERFDVDQLVLEAVRSGVDFALRQGIEHERVVGIGAMADADQAGRPVARFSFGNHHGIPRRRPPSGGSRLMMGIGFHYFGRWPAVLQLAPLAVLPLNRLVYLLTVDRYFPGAWIPKRTLSPRISTMVTTTLSPITMLSSRCRDRTSIIGSLQNYLPR